MLQKFFCFFIVFLYTLAKYGINFDTIKLDTFFNVLGKAYRALTELGMNAHMSYAHDADGRVNEAVTVEAGAASLAARRGRTEQAAGLIKRRVVCEARELELHRPHPTGGGAGGPGN